MIPRISKPRVRGSNPLGRANNLIEAFILGAKAEVQVTGKWNNDLMKQIKKPSKIGE